jgi:hypothetical protein
MAVALLLMDAVVALKAAEVAAATTITDAGTVSAVVEFERETVAPPLGAGCVRVTLHLPEEFDPKVFGLHVSADTRAVATRLMLVVAEVPL